MSDLKDAFAAAGCTGVRTYIQSGNVIFETPEENTTAVFQRVQLKLRDLLGDKPVLLFRTVRQVERISRNWSTVTKIVEFLRKEPDD